MKKILAFIIVVSMMLSYLAFPAFAETVTIEYWIDNDTSDTTNCFNIREGYTAYIKDSGYYNGDLRRTYSNSKDCYSWVRKNSFGNKVKNSPIYMVVGVYLKSNVLSDTAARYWCMQNDGAYLMFSMNQSTNANGWSYNYYTLKKNYQISGWYSIKGIEVMTSQTGSGYSAADAVYVFASTPAG